MAIPLELDGEEEMGDDVEDVACCPECESLEIREMPAASPRQITLWSAAIPFPEPPRRLERRWKCLMCGYQWREADSRRTAPTSTAIGNYEYKPGKEQRVFPARGRPGMRKWTFLPYRYDPS